MSHLRENYREAKTKFSVYKHITTYKIALLNNYISQISPYAHQSTIEHVAWMKYFKFLHDIYVCTLYYTFFFFVYFAWEAD